MEELTNQSSNHRISNNSDHCRFFMDGDISHESKLFLNQHLPHHKASHIGFMQYAYGVAISSLSMIYQLRGIIGLILVPLHFALLLLIMILKLLILNPPFCSNLQSSISFELSTPAKVATSIKFRQGIDEMYSLKDQMTKRPTVGTKFVAQRSIWWEDIVLLKFIRLPLFPVLYGSLDDSEGGIVILQLSVWCLHALTGVVFIKEKILKEQPGTRQVVVLGHFKCWNVLRPVYHWIMTSTFEPYLSQLLSLSEDHLVVDGKFKRL